MTVYGLTSTGFVPKTRVIVRGEIDANLRGAFGQSIRLGDRSLLGHVSGVMSDKFGELWDLAQAVNASGDPDAATGPNLDALSALTGTTRVPARESTVVGTLGGTPGTVVLAGNRAATASTGASFRTLTDATIAILTPWVTTTVYVVGDRVRNASRGYVCITAGTSSAPAPTSQSADFADGGGVHWRYMGEGDGAVDVDMKSLDTGPVVAVADDLTVKLTAVSGWQTVRNLLDAVPGVDVETNEDMRVRREDELSADGESTTDAMRGDLEKLDGVTAVTVFENITDATDGDGIPAHAFEVLIQGGVDQAIRDIILKHKPLGITAHGSTTGTAVDGAGVSHEIDFTRPSVVTIFVDITLKYDATLYPADGDAEVKLAIATRGNGFGAGADAVATRLAAAAFTVPGVFDVPRSGSLGGVLIKVSSGPTADTTIVITSRQIATYDTSRITTHSSAGTP